MVYSWKDGLPSGGAVLENTNDPFVTLAAKDGEVEAFSYSLSGGHRGLFEIDAHGVLSLKNALNYESSSSSRIRFPSDRIFTVMVRAHADDGARVLETPFVLTLQDENEFETDWRNGRGYNSSGRNLNENNDAGYRVAQFRARDGDNQNDINYTLSGTDAALFSIEDRSGGVGRLYLKDSLDYDDSHVAFYSVIVNANSTDASPAVSRLYVLTLINREDANWETNGNPSGATVSESAGIGTALVDFDATADAGNGTLTYGLRGRHRDDSYFQIDKNTGALTTKKEFTNENKDHYTVVVRAQADDGGDRIEQTFILTITEENDHATEWRNGRGYNSSGRNLNENNDAGYRVAQFRATDGDRVDIDYSLTGTDAALFSIEDRSGGVGRLYLKDSLNFEDSHVAFYSVIVNANSTDDSSQTNVVSQLYVLTLNDRNDNDTTWETGGNHTGATVSESTGIGTALVDFGATDGDASATVTYGLRGRHRDDSYFQIDKDTGELTTKKEFTNENKDHYTVVVRARADDGGDRIEQIFVLTITEENDFDTEWRDGGYRGGRYNQDGRSFSESNSIGSEVARFRAADGDRVDITYSLTNIDNTSTDAAYFSIDSRGGGEGRLYAVSSLDFEAKEFYTVVINATSTDTDLSQTNVVSQTYILSLTDRDDTDWQANGNPNGLVISENLNVSILILDDFRAVDDGGETITYGLRTGRNDRDAKYFEIDARTGELIIKADFNFEDQDHYTVTVLARAGGAGDRAEQTYILTVTDANDSPEWVRQSQPLNGRGDRKDETPDGDQKVTIGEAVDGDRSNAVAGRQVAKYKAIDEDTANDANVQMTYSVTGRDRAYFSIDSDGRLFLASSLDFEDSFHSAKNYSIIVNARSTVGDNKVSNAVSNIFILTLTDRDDANWQFGNPNGNTISENSGVGVTLADFNATDDDGDTVTYGLRAGRNDSDAKYFEIDADTGVLTTKSDLNFEDKDHYTVTVRARAGGDGGRAEETFILTITDANDSPEWVRQKQPLNSGRDRKDEIPDGEQTIRIGEAIDGSTSNAVAGRQVAKYKAIDDDTDKDSTIQVTYSLTGNSGADDSAYFTIDSNGRLFLTSNLDYEDTNHTAKIYSVIIIARSTDDSPSTISNLFVLTLTDREESARWTTEPTGATFAENNAINDPVFTLNAIDGDGDGVTYGIRSRHRDDKYFAIDKDSGELTVKSIFDLETSKDYYTVVVRARSDEGGGRSTDEQTFVLTIVEEMFIEWETNSNPTGATLVENNTIGTSLADFGATDADGTATVTYSLSGDDNVYFEINATTGVLTAKSAFDFENPDHTDGLYSVRVSAIATDDGASINQIFVLTITDVDNTTAFTAGSGGLTISENKTVAFAAADRIDDFGNATTASGINITYGLSSGDADYFSIDANTGWLFITSSFDFENPANATNRYSVTIIANADFDGTAVTRLFVLTINDANDAPTWLQNPASYGDNGIIAENNNPATALATFIATDLDAGDTIASYSLDSTTTDATYFSINADNGVLFAISAFDHEHASHDNSYHVRIVAHSTDATTASHDFRITIGNENDNDTSWENNGNPTGNTLGENNSIGTSIADFNATDLDGATVTYSLSGNDTAYFNINATTGVLTAKSAFDFEHPNHGALYSVVVNANSLDGSDPITQTFVLTVSDAGNNTTDWASNTVAGGDLDENNTQDTRLWDFRNGASGDTITYGLSGGDTSYFRIDNIIGGDGNEFGRLHATSSFDYESTYGQSINNRYSVIITANANVEGTAISQTYILTIADVSNPTPDWKSTTPNGHSFAENNDNNHGLWFFRNDGDGYDELPDGVSITYGLSGDSDNTEYFTQFASGLLRVKGKIFDYESDYGQSINNRYSITIIASANVEGTAVSRIHIMTITDVNNATPDWNSNTPNGHTVNENNGYGGLWHFSNDGELPDGVSITYGISGNTEYFTMFPDGSLFAKGSLDYESDYGQSINNRYSVIVTANTTVEGTAISRIHIMTIADVDESGGFLPLDPTPDQPVGINGKILFDPTADNLGGINDGISNDGLVIIGNDLSVTQYDSVSATNTDLVLNNIENFEQSFVGYTDADGNTQNHWFFVRDDAGDNTGHIVFDADGLDVNLDSLSQGGATTTPDQINLLAGLNFGSDGDFAKPDDLDLNLNNNQAASLTHDQFLALIGGSNNIDFI